MSDNTEQFGSPGKPMKVKCATFGDQGADVVYVTAVTEKGSHIHLGFSRTQAQMIGLQMLNSAIGKS
jgi:hypothetical protein